MPNKGNPVKIILADDHTIVREAMKNLLQKVTDFRIIGEASTGEEVINLVRKLAPNIVLMDIKMPGIGGLEATRKLQTISPETRIVVLTSCSDDIFPRYFLKAGAAGYLTKTSGLDEMVKALTAVQAGKRYIVPEIANKLAMNHVEGNKSNPFDTLSSRELQVCLMIIRGDRPQYIAEKLCLSPKTVNSYRYRIYEKLGISSDVGLTLLAIKHGLIEEEVLVTTE